MFERNELLQVFLNFESDDRFRLRPIQFGFLSGEGLSLLANHFEILPPGQLDSLSISDFPAIFFEYRGKRFSLLWFTSHAIKNVPNVPLRTSILQSSPILKKFAYVGVPALCRRPVVDIPYGRKGIFPAYAAKIESHNLQVRNDDLDRDLASATSSCNHSTTDRRRSEQSQNAKLTVIWMWDRFTDFPTRIHNFVNCCLSTTLPFKQPREVNEAAPGPPEIS